ncbi:MAG: hypothetical protein P4L51_23660 [Puia sp.]|nr:hypothetical protein [Puia sp.]
MRLINLPLVGALLLSTSLSVSAKSKMSWPVWYRGQVLSHIINAENAFDYIPYSDSAKGRLVFRFSRTDNYFHEEAQEERVKAAMDIYRMVFSYVLADSLDFFSDVTLSFYYGLDTSLHIDFTYGPGLMDSLNINDRSPEERLILLSSVIPMHSLMVDNPSDKYKHRIIGFSLPSNVEWMGYKWDEIEMSNFATAIASIVYDFVLKRDDKVVSKIVIQFNENYHDLNNPARANVYPIDCAFIQDIKNRNLMMFGGIDANLEKTVLPTSVEERLAAISYLVQGEAHYSYTPPTTMMKGRCTFDFYCKKSNTVFPHDNNPHLVAQFWANLIMSYSFADSLKNYDTITVRIFDKYLSPVGGWAFPVPDAFPHTIEDSRMTALLNSLPFTAKANFNNNDFEILLEELPDYSPIEHLGIYVSILSFVTYDYVFNRQHRQPIISFVNKKDEGQKYYPRVKVYNGVVYYLKSLTRR